MLFNSIFTSEGSTNCIYEFLKLLNIPVTRTSLKKDLNDHPGHPGLLAISDVLTRYNVENRCYKIGADKIPSLPLPFIALVNGRNNTADGFTVIKAIEESKVRMYHAEKNAWQYTPLQELINYWTGIVLVAQPLALTGEKDFSRKLLAERTGKLLNRLMLFFLPLAVVCSCILVMLRSGWPALPIVFLFLLLVAGSLISSLLLWYELEPQRALFKKVCTRGDHIDCHAVLQSGSSGIAGIKWSLLGFGYFAGSLLGLLLTATAGLQALSLLAWINLLTVPYILFAVFYQWLVIRKWCVLCLAVKSVLLLQLLLGWSAGWFKGITLAELQAQTILVMAVSFFIPLGLGGLLLPTYRQNLGNRYNIAVLKRLKYDRAVFDQLLAREKPLLVNTDGLGLVLGSESPTSKIVKVCDPLCTPCSETHGLLKELLRSNPRLQLQIIYAPVNNEQDARAPVIKHLLALAEMGDQQLLKQALDDWYGQSEKSYAHLAGRFPLPDNLQLQTPKLQAMADWCQQMDIAVLPTIFVNGFQLPDIYDVNDLRYLL